MAIQSQRSEEDSMAVVTADDIREILQRTHVLYDRAGGCESERKSVANRNFLVYILVCRFYVHIGKSQ